MHTARPPYFSIALVSGCALAYEILLTRLFSIIQWHHFAYMIISLALLGYGASGTVLSLTQRYWKNWYSVVYLSQLSLFGLSAAGCFLLAQHLAFNPEEILWDSKQALLLCATYLLLSFPFFLAANSVALTIAKFRSDIARIYAVNMVGSV